MAIPQPDQRLTLQKEQLTTEGLCIEVRENPAQPGGILLKVLVREHFDPGDQCWLVDAAQERIGAKVQSVAHHSGDRELTLAAMVPPDARWEPGN